MINSVSLFKNNPKHELVEYDWLTHDDFIDVVQSMDLGMQVSFTETFNIVTADFVNNNIPVVVSKEIPWVNPLFFANLIYLNDELAGFSLWYYRFSTWKGRRFYLEDLYIKESFRGKGLGKRLILEAIEEAKRMHCTGMMWQVLDWNQPAIEVYRAMGAQAMDEWTVYRVSGQELKDLASE